MSLIYFAYNKQLGAIDSDSKNFVCCEAMKVFKILIIDAGCSADFGDRSAKHDRHGGAGVGGRQAVVACEPHVFGMPGGVRGVHDGDAADGGILRRPHVCRHRVRPLVRRQLLVHAGAARAAGRHGQVLCRLRPHSARSGRWQPSRTTNCRQIFYMSYILILTCRRLGKITFYFYRHLF